MVFLTLGIGKVHARPLPPQESGCGEGPVEGGAVAKDNDCAIWVWTEDSGYHTADRDCNKPKQGGGTHSDNRCGLQTYSSHAAHEDDDCANTGSDSDCGMSTSELPESPGYEDNDCQYGNNDADCGILNVSFGSTAHTDSSCEYTDEACGMASSGGGIIQDQDCGGMGWSDADCSRSIQTGDNDCTPSGSPGDRTCTSGPGDTPNGPKPPNDPTQPNGWNSG